MNIGETEESPEYIWNPWRYRPMIPPLALRHLANQYVKRSRSVSSGPYTGDQVLVPGSMRAYRAWRFREGLMSVTATGNWHTGRNEAQCHVLRVSPPFRPREFHGKGCTCGFYGLHQPSWYEAYYYDASMIRGCFKATGQVVVGSTGLRAQFAEIEALLSLDVWVNRTLKRLYKVPVYTEEAQFLADFPPIPSDLIPPSLSRDGYDCPCGCGGRMIPVPNMPFASITHTPSSPPVVISSSQMKLMGAR